jgi:hypothetical protein
MRSPTSRVLTANTKRFWLEVADTFTLLTDPKALQDDNLFFVSF